MEAFSMSAQCPMGMHVALQMDTLPVKDILGTARAMCLFAKNLERGRRRSRFSMLPYEA